MRLNYFMLHDDGQHVEGLEEADVVLVGVSRTSKTPTSIYLANRGIRTANVPLVPGIAIPHQLEMLKKPLVVSLHATPERLIQVRQNRLLSIGAGPGNDTYIDRQAVADEVAYGAAIERQVQLGAARRHPAIDRGNCGCCAEVVYRQAAATAFGMTLWRGKYPLILASQSRARQMLLANAGIDFEAVPANIDEREVEQSSRLSSPGDIAAVLARRESPCGVGAATGPICYRRGPDTGARLESSLSNRRAAGKQPSN